MRYEEFVNESLEDFNSALKERLEEGMQGLAVEEAMVYTIKSGGKRFRPMLMLGVVDTHQVNVEKAYPAAMALELVHTYSLIHDDLPAMDNDDLRRGQPANHIVYGEGTAILAGDGLLTKAFEIISETTASSSLSLELIKRLALAAGHQGMIGGQQADLEAEGRDDVTYDDLKSIYYRKTGALIEFAFIGGALLANLNLEWVTLLAAFGRKLGLAFQIQDDILDVTEDEESLGKPAGSDLAQDKATAVSLLGLEGAKEELENIGSDLRDLVDKMSHMDTELDLSFYESLIDTFVSE